MKPALRSLESWVAATLVLALKAYRLLLSPWLGNACRFEPTCSRYAIEAIETLGPWHGSYLMARRVVRCHPGCSGGHDPVPPKRSQTNTRRSDPTPAAAATTHDQRLH